MSNSCQVDCLWNDHQLWGNDRGLDWICKCYMWPDARLWSWAYSCSLMSWSPIDVKVLLPADISSTSVGWMASICTQTGHLELQFCGLASTTTFGWKTLKRHRIGEILQKMSLAHFRVFVLDFIVFIFCFCTIFSLHTKLFVVEKHLHTCKWVSGWFSLTSGWI